ncbi:MAG: hypothetical protein ACJ77E_11525 [Gaiellaceae bacterium]
MKRAPRQNRVTALGELVATPARGLVYGNRGCLHDGAGRIRRRYSGKRWIACRLRFKDWRRSPLLQPGRFTELFFLDEATAFAAGHRPCALCRREDYNAFLTLVGASSADEVDARLHEERLEPGTRAQRRHPAALDELPDGSFVLHDGDPYVVRGDRLLAWSPAGYARPVRRPRGTETLLLTPPSLVAVIRAGWHSSAVVFLHPSASA